MKLFLLLVLQLLFMLIPCRLQAQSQSRKVRQAERRSEKLQEREKKDYEKRRKETLKHRYEIQSPEVQQRMKETEKRSRLYGRKQKEPFYKKIFNRKGKRRKRK